MTLRDHFMEKWGVYSHTRDLSVEPTSKDKESDATWALTFLSSYKVQSVSEAFDDDASGFITVTEVNNFTTSRPMGWRCVCP